jgi:murein DD-endopeptidase MepM/ murein hydrolase activator NlpD
LDLAGPELGEPIYAADGGEVIFAGDNGSYGLMVKIRHEDSVMTYYAHMNALSVKVGDRVYKGQKIGEIGRTGKVTGVHLHFEVRIDGKTVDPLNYLPKK